ncbi:hypothetical protein Pmani_038752 [Petrolisthes manimaculis]|uniref:Uncharacterized protein n=1 Tax=Petrolisthes manimaculis TaxID=1843537 RepID=A0AAE1NE20_9EUCA|nr:hypothetical protein Pmani_038752 [Petrolisthes manimaculis]
MYEKGPHGLSTQRNSIPTPLHAPPLHSITTPPQHHSTSPTNHPPLNPIPLHPIITFSLSLHSQPLT